MLRVSAIATVMICGAIGPFAALAQDRDKYVPAELPPASYSAPQYVDSSGCAFVRAGYGGKVRWVPRVTLNRDPVCGMMPSLQAAGGRAPEAVAPVVVSQPSPPEPEPPTRPRQEAVRVALPAPTIAAPEGATAVTPGPQATIGTAAMNGRAQTGRLAGCPHSHPYGQQVATGDGRQVLRCTASPSALIRGTVQVPNATAPKAVISAQVRAPTPASTAPSTAVRSDVRPTEIPIPKGYKAVWSDGRLNPYRGGRTEAGRVAMGAIWTETVPRRLVSPGAAAVISAAPEHPAGARLSTRSAPSMEVKGRSGS